MTPVAILRCVLAALVTFALVALVLGAGLAAIPSNGSTGAYVFLGAAALLAPLAGTVAGAWQAHAAGTRRPIVGILVAAAVVLVVGLAGFATNDTLSDTFDALQPILVLAGTVAGAFAYGGRWYGSTARI